MIPGELWGELFFFSVPAVSVGLHFKLNPESLGAPDAWALTPVDMATASTHELVTFVNFERIFCILSRTFQTYENTQDSGD